MTLVELTIAQHSKLDRLEPEAKVVGWSHECPVIRRPNGVHHRIDPGGRLRVLRNWNERKT